MDHIYCFLTENLYLSLLKVQISDKISGIFTKKYHIFYIFSFLHLVFLDFIIIFAATNFQKL